MKSLTLTAPGELKWLDIPEPRLTSEEGAIVRPIAVSVCDFDRAVVKGKYTALRYPIAVGHEIVAEVVEIGSSVREVKPGVRVVLPLHISCGTCPNCSYGHTNSCKSRPPLSNYGLGSVGGDWGGGMSDLLFVPYADAMAVPIPATHNPVDYAAIGCNLVDLYRTLAPYISGAMDQSVLIVSGEAHNMAFYGIVMAKALGLKNIHFCDDDQDRLSTAAMLGAQPVKLGQKLPELYDIVIDCSGDPNRLAIGLAHVGHDGVCTTVWPYSKSFDIPVNAMFQRNATFVTGQPHALSLINPVLELIQEGKISTNSIPTGILPWEDAERAFGFGRKKRIFVRD